MNTPKKAFRGNQSLKSIIARTTRTAERKRGFAESRLLSEWETIIGTPLCHYCAPKKLSYDRFEREASALHVLCEPAWALEIQQLEPIIKDKIATFFGYQAVGRIVIHQGALPPKQNAKKQSTEVVPTQVDASTQKLLQSVQDPGMLAALTRLAQARKAGEATGDAKDNAT